MIKGALIEVFNYKPLLLADFLELIKILMEEQLPPEVASSIGAGEPYVELRESYFRLLEVYERNPKLLETAEIVRRIKKLRHQLSHLNIRLKNSVMNYEGELLVAAKVVGHAARPFLQDIRRLHQAGLTGIAGELVIELRKPDLTPLVTLLELDSQLSIINQLQQECHELLTQRGDEKAFQKALGTATGARKILTKQLRFFFYLVLPAIYALNQGSEQALKIEAVAIKINGTLNTFRHLLPTREKASE